MKKSYNSIFSIIVFLLSFACSFAQTRIPVPTPLDTLLLERVEEPLDTETLENDVLINSSSTLKTAEFSTNKKTDLTKVGFVPKPPCDCTEGILNFTFNSTSSYLLNHQASQINAERQYHIWVNEQYNRMEKEIERQLGKEFPNFNDAQKEFFKNYEIPPVNVAANHLSPKYNQKVTEKETVRFKNLRNIKLLDLRANEINSGITNSQYGHLKYNSTPLSQLTTLNAIKPLRLQEVNGFSDNQWRLDQELKIKNLLVNELARLNNSSHDILNELFNFQIGHYNAAGYTVQKLDHMQQYINNRNFNFQGAGPVMLPWIKVRSFGNLDFVEPYIWRKNPALLSIFHDEYWTNQISALINQLGWHPGPAISVINGRKDFERNAAINQALSQISTEDFLAATAIAGLGMRNENFIKNKPGLKAEIDAYFKANNFSKVSHDGINYLLNQYLDGNSFAVDTNLFVSNGTPLFQDTQNPNRALQWQPTPYAITQGLTNFGNVLSELLKDNVNPEYEGRIIRDMFAANGFNFSNYLQNSWIGTAFSFQKNNGQSVVINYTNNNGLELLNRGINTNNYLTSFIDNLNQKLDAALTTDEKNWLFAKPEFVNKLNDFLAANINSLEAKNDAKMKIMAERVNDTDPRTPKWDFSKKGTFLDRPALKYGATHNPNLGETMYLLDNGMVLYQSAIKRSINKNIPNTIASTEQVTDGFNYLYDSGSRTWYEYRLPLQNFPDADINFLLDGFWNGVKIVGRYATPLEDIIILIDGKDFDFAEQNRVYTAGIMIFGVIPGGKLMKPIAKAIKGADKVWVVVVKVGNKTYTRVVKELTEEVLQHFDRYAPGTRDLIDEALRKGDFLDDEIIIEVSEEIADLAATKGRNFTWEEVKALFKRGHDFNAKARDSYEFNEIVLETGKRLDTYIPGKEIISRKATTLSNIKPETFKRYLKELIIKYPKGSVLKSSQFPKGTKLIGDYFLEIPLSNKTFFENNTIFKQVLTQFNLDNKVIVRIKYLAE